MEENKIKREDVPEVLRTALKAGKTNFVFIKKDGSRRAAVGTLNLDDVPEADKQFKHSEGDNQERPDQTSYYDLEKSGWRCCKFDSVVEIEGKEVE